MFHLDGNQQSSFFSNLGIRRRDVHHCGEEEGLWILPFPVGLLHGDPHVWILVDLDFCSGDAK